MPQELETLNAGVGNDGPPVSSKSSAGLDSRKDKEKLDAFLAELRRMTSEERLRASRYTFNRWELYVWAGRFPEEVPLINGEYEWIALRSVDVLE